MQKRIPCYLIHDDYPRIPGAFTTEILRNAGVPPKKVLRHVQMKIVSPTNVYGYSYNNTLGTQKRNKKTVWACEGGGLNVLLELLGLEPVAE